MSHKKLIYGFLLFLFALNLIFAGIIFSFQGRKLRIIFLDVGQGDAILISRGTNQILIDGGPGGQGLLEKLGEYLPFWDREIEVLVATHPDQDHIGGFSSVIENYEISIVIDNGMESDSQTYKNYAEAINSRKISRLRGKKGMKIKIAEADLEILYPGSAPEKNSKDTNAQSLVAELVFGQNSFLFTGDLPAEKEKDFFALNADLSAKVLKVAHHGSKYSTSEEFLVKVNPQEAVISAGKNNRYSHPSPEILDRLAKRKINILRTDERGDIGYVCENIREGCLLEAK